MVCCLGRFCWPVLCSSADLAGNQKNCPASRWLAVPTGKRFDPTIAILAPPVRPWLNVMLGKLALAVKDVTDGKITLTIHGAGIRESDSEILGEMAAGRICFRQMLPDIQQAPAEYRTRREP
ncbi:MAG: hypothetical protein ACOC3F_00320 [Desulfosudaceae bacterium]